MYVCSHVPTRCSALGRSATQNSARPYYLRFVSWLQTITHFPGSSHLSPFSSLWLYISRTVPLFVSFPFSSPASTPVPTPLSLSLSLSSSLSSFCSHFPTSFARSPSSLCALRFSFMIVHRAQLRNGFIIELPSAMNLSLF